MKQTAAVDEAISPSGEDRLKRRPAILLPNEYGESDMWTLISFIYREYCRVRLAEIRRYRLATAA